MKTSSSPTFPRFVRQLYRLGFLAGLVCLLGVAYVAQAQFSMQPGTNQYNIYTYDGATSTGTGTDPAAQGTPLPTFQYLSYGTAIPGIGSFTFSSSSPTASVNFSAGSDPTVSGTTLSLTYSGANQDELRLDWMATYFNYSGNSQTTPLGFAINISGTANTYAAFAGQESFYYGGNTVTATILNNGFPSGTYGLSNGPWWGSTSSSFSSTIYPSFGSSLTIPNGDGFVVSGYMDLLVDPSSIQIQIESVPEPGVWAFLLLGGLGLFVGRRAADIFCGRGVA